MEKLEKLEFGGVRGKSLSDQTVAIHQEFTNCWKVFKESSYDSFDVKNEVSYNGYITEKNFLNSKKSILDQVMFYQNSLTY